MDFGLYLKQFKSNTFIKILQGPVYLMQGAKMTPTKDSDFWKGVQTNNRGPTYNVNSKEDMDNLLDMLEVLNSLDI